MSTSVEPSAGSREYVVLARRYRPRRFDQVLGQEHVTKTLQNAIQLGRVHHAYLFSGSRGVGKTTVARILAKALNCETGPTPTPCGKCRMCDSGGSSVDVQEIDGASHTGVDDIRELRENVRYAPAEARRKIYIIDEVHMLSTSAFNALLKTLEEPPAHVVFVFATTEAHKIPTTIISRCQRFDFKRVAIDDIDQHLQELLKQEDYRIDDAGRRLIARAAEGSVRDALSLLDLVIAYGNQGSTQPTMDAAQVAQVLGVADRRILFELSAAILAQQAAEALAIVERVYTDGQDLPQFVQSLVSHWRDLVVTRTCEDPQALVDATDAELAELGEQARGQEPSLLSQHFERLIQVAEQVHRSSFPRLVLEMAVVELAQVQSWSSLEALVERLERLEADLSSNPPSGDAGDGGGIRPAPAERPAIKEVPRTKSGANAAPTKSRANAAPSQEVASRPARADGAGDGEAVAERSAEPADKCEPESEPAKPESPPSDAPVNRWRQLLEKVDEQDPALAAVYASGKVLRAQQHALELGYLEGSFEYSRAADRKRLARFTDKVFELTGQQLSLKLSALAEAEYQALDAAGQNSIAQERDQEIEDQATRLRQEALEHPLTKAFIERFGANVDSVSTTLDSPTGDHRARDHQQPN